MSVDSTTLGLPTTKARSMTETLTMNSKERKRSHIMRLLIAGQMSVPEASADLGITERHCYRMKAAFLVHGDAALVHGLRGKPSNFRYIDEARDEVFTLIRCLYPNIAQHCSMISTRNDASSASIRRRCGGG